MRNFKFWCYLSVVGSLLLFSPAVAYEAPRQVLDKAVVNFSKNTTFSFVGSIIMKDTTKPIKYSKTYTSPARIATVKSNLIGQFNAVNPQSKKYDLYADLDVNSGSLQFKDLQMNAVGFGHNFYFRINYPGDVNMFDVELNQILNQWVLIDRDSIFKDYLSTNYSSLVDKNIVNTELNLQKLKSVLDVLRKNNVVVLTKLKDEKINNVNTYHYNYRINKTGLRNFLVALSKQTQSTQTIKSSEIKSLDTWLKNEMLPSGSIWIGKKDYNIYRITFVQHKNDKTKQVNNIVDLKFNNFNKEIYINTPDNFMTFEQLLDKIKIISNNSSTPLMLNPINISL